jgi:hypothetical protein
MLCTLHCTCTAQRSTMTALDLLPRPPAVSAAAAHLPHFVNGCVSCEGQADLLGLQHRGNTRHGQFNAAQHRADKAMQRVSRGAPDRTMHVAILTRPELAQRHNVAASSSCLLPAAPVPASGPLIATESFQPLQQHALAMLTLSKTSALVQPHAAPRAPAPLRGAQQHACGGCGCLAGLLLRGVTQCDARTLRKGQAMCACAHVPQLPHPHRAIPASPQPRR